MNRPRILLILTEFPPRIGGMQTHAHALAKHLQEKGYPIQVLTYRANRHEEKDAESTFDVHLNFPVKRILSRLGFWNNLSVIEEESKLFKPDVIYSSTVFYGLLRKRIGIPVLCRSVGNDVMRPWIVYPFRFMSKFLSIKGVEQPIYNLFKQFNYPEWIELVFRKRRRNVMEESARQMDHIMANSTFTADLLRDLNIEDKRIEVLSGGVDAARFKNLNPRKKKLRQELGLPLKCFLITTACRLVAKKGIDFLLPSFVELRKKMPDAHLLIIGEGRHEKKYRRMARKLGLEEHVTFSGRVEHTQIHKYYWASNLFVLASRVQVNPASGLRDAETMGRVLCEANAAGIPVVASRSGGIPSVIRNKRNGLLFQPDDTEELIKQVRRIRRDRTLKKEMIKTGLSWAEKRYDWSVIVKAHEKAINNQLKPAAARIPPKKKKRGQPASKAIPA